MEPCRISDTMRCRDRNGVIQGRVTHSDKPPAGPIHIRRLLCAALSAVFGAVACHAVAAQPSPPQLLELTAANLASVVDPLMTEWVDRRKGPGAVVVVVTRDGPVFAKGYGFADIDAGKPFTADATLVRPGSISKLFTGIAVMQLVDAGRLDLDSDVNRYIDFAVPVPAGGVAVTLRRLLTHRAGFEEHLKGLFSRNHEPAPLGRWLAQNLPLRLFPGGDVEAYSNCGIALAGYVVERVSGVPFASYVQGHILDPLGMNHSTFRQPLPDDLSLLMAKGRRASDVPALPFFEVILAPAGGLTATGADMGRFVRALLNGGALDGARILSAARLDEMMAPQSATPAGYLGLVFVGTKVAGHDSIGHDGETMMFFSDLRLFPHEGIGIFVSRDGTGEIRTAEEIKEIPDPVMAIARRFLPRTPEPGIAPAAFPRNASMARVYHSSRRAESSFLRFTDLISQYLVRIDGDGNAKLFSAIWPFGDGATFRRVAPKLYEGPAGTRIAFMEDPGSEPSIAQPAVRLDRVPWWLDVRWVAPAFALSTAIVFVTLLAWPFAALWRRWRKQPWSKEKGGRRRFLAVRLVVLVDAIVIVATVVLFFTPFIDPTMFNEALDPVIVAVYVLAWLGVCGAVLALWTAVLFWRSGIGSRWSRIHHCLLAASALMLAWLFLTFRIAGTTLTY
jgi:CubicO group peptidase (beta-lactamase class C family)